MRICYLLSAYLIFVPISVDASFFDDLVGKVDMGLANMQANIDFSKCTKRNNGFSFGGIAATEQAEDEDVGDCPKVYTYSKDEALQMLVEERSKLKAPENDQQVRLLSELDGALHSNDYEQLGREHYDYILSLFSTIRKYVSRILKIEQGPTHQAIMQSSKETIKITYLSR
ncbi:hypothetical protein ISS03_03265 [Patescibacteria group bacterium]|nr:hypothetical protein [Patescibacteria group bacterium]